MNKSQAIKLIFSLLFPILFSSVTLCGCYDRAELDERALVMSIAIDKTEDNDFLLSMEIPSDFEAKDSDNKANVKIGKDKTINSAMKKIDAISSQRLYYGHTKACILSRELLENPDMLKSALDGLERNREISRKLILMATDGRADTIYDAKTDVNSLTGIFINDFYKNNSSTLSTTFHQDLETTIAELLSGSNAIIPVIKRDGDNLKISGLALIKDYRLIALLNENESRGLLWLISRADRKIGGELSVPFENSEAALRITDEKSKLRLEKNPSGDFDIICDIRLEGTIDEFIINKDIFDSSQRYKMLQDEYIHLINSEAENAFNIIHNEYKTDVIGFSELLRKNYPADYSALKGNTSSLFDNARLVLNTEVVIRGSGTIK